MRLLFCHPAVDFSVSDVARGYLNALHRQGHDIREYHLSKRLLYHHRAIGEPFKDDARALAKQASETILNEAIYHDAELVLIISGLCFHPIGLQLLQWGGFRTAAVMTESPYDDDDQAEWAAHYPDLTVFTHDRISAQRYGWGYLPHAFDPTYHYPRAAAPVHDVLIVGTGWPDRQRLLEQVDWTDIRLAIRGLWLGITSDSPLAPYYRGGCIDNVLLPALYAASRICVNVHRAHPTAMSLNPRAYELAACGAFQLSDPRADGFALFGDTVPTFTSPDELGRLVRRYLAEPEARDQCAAHARQRVQGETFDARAAVLMAALGQTVAAPLAASV